MHWLTKYTNKESTSCSYYTLHSVSSFHPPSTTPLYDGALFGLRREGLACETSTLSHDRKSAGVMSQLRSKQSAKAPSPENSLAIGGSFECSTFLVTALDWLKKERKMKNSDFWPFQVCLFKMVAVRCHYHCRLEQAF